MEQDVATGMAVELDESSRWLLLQGITGEPVERRWLENVRQTQGQVSA